MSTFTSNLYLKIKFSFEAIENIDVIQSTEVGDYGIEVQRYWATV